MGRRENRLLCARVVLLAQWIDVRRVIREWVVQAHDAVAGGVEGASDDVEVVDFVAAKKKRQADVPVCLLATAEDCDVVDRLALFKEHG